MPSRRPDAVLVSIGGNDLYGSSTARLVTTVCPSCSMRFVMPQVRAVVHRLHRINPAARVILLGLYNPYRERPFIERQVNLWDAGLIQTFALDRYVDVVRIADLLARQRRSARSTTSTRQLPATR